MGVCAGRLVLLSLVEMVCVNKCAREHLEYYMYPMFGLPMLRKWPAAAFETVLLCVLLVASLPRLSLVCYTQGVRRDLAKKLQAVYTGTL